MVFVHPCSFLIPRSQNKSFLLRSCFMVHVKVGGARKLPTDGRGERMAERHKETQGQSSSVEFQWRPSAGVFEIAGREFGSFNPFRPLVTSRSASRNLANYGSTLFVLLILHSVPNLRRH